jgi:hypothetical protein
MADDIIDNGALCAFGSGYVQATPNQVREVLRLSGLTGSAAGVLVGVNSRTVRKWSGGETAIPYAAWRLLCQYVGIVTAETRL